MFKETILQQSYIHFLQSPVMLCSVKKSVCEVVIPIVSPKRTIQNIRVDRDVHAELTIYVFACVCVYVDVYEFMYAEQ